MKIFSFIFVAFLFISEVSAQRINNLVIFGNDGERFTLIVNGLRYNNTPATTVKAEDLTLKVYKVKIIFENKDIKDLDTDITFFGTNNECVFGLVKKNRRKYTLDYVSDKKIIPVSNPEPTETTNTNYSSSPITDSAPSNTTTSSTTTPPTTTPSQDHSTIGINAGGVNIGVNQNGSLKLGTKSGNINMNTKDKSGNVVLNTGIGDGIVLHKAAAKTNCPTAMNGNEFEIVKKDVSSQTSEESKLTTATSLLEGKCFSTSHVKQIMQLFAEEKSKLEFAKSAYSHTNDISNYNQVKEALTTEEKKVELQAYVHNQKK